MDQTITPTAQKEHVKSTAAKKKICFECALK